MSEIKYFVERKRDGPRELVVGLGGTRSMAGVTNRLIKFIFFNLK